MLSYLHNMPVTSAMNHEHSKICYVYISVLIFRKKERKKKHTDINKASLMQYASCMKLVDKWTQKYRISNAYRIMHYFSIRLVFFLIYNNYWARNNLVKRSPVIATCVSSKAYILRGSLNAKFIWSIMPCVRIVLLWTLFYAYFFCICWNLLI